jgi:L-alanine-DL-glutamate epimerase-like enolase superfamily enzyme
MLRQRAVRPVGCELFLLPVRTRVPLRFGTETLTSVTCARVRMSVQCADGKRVDGWGETPLSVQWVWPAEFSYQLRYDAIIEFCTILLKAWATCGIEGHALEIGHAFQNDVLPALLQAFNRDRPQPLPYLAALLCCSPFDIALHDAFGQAMGRPTYQTYTRDYLELDLADFLASADRSVDFRGLYPQDFLDQEPPSALPAWHLVGALDPLGLSDLTGAEPQDGYPVLLEDWIRRDGLTALKIKLNGKDEQWDYARLIDVGRIAQRHAITRLCADFNCTVTDPSYVERILDRLLAGHPEIYNALLYVEQPFPYDLHRNRIDVRSISSRKPLLMDESAHDWRLVQLGRSLGWNGVALKTCKTQTGALLTLCWARAQGMHIMVQDLTNPMLAMIPHALLAAHAQTMFGLESNAPQFYPDASLPEARVHPGLFARREGKVDFTTLRGAGFGYRLREIDRALPDAASSYFT